MGKFLLQFPDIFVLFRRRQKTCTPQQQGLYGKRFVSITQQNTVRQQKRQLIEGLRIHIPGPIFAHEAVETLFPIVESLVHHEFDVPAFSLQAFYRHGLKDHLKIRFIDSV